MIDFNTVTPYDSLNYNELAQTCRDCQLCGLKETRTQVVVGHGPVPCPLMIIGEGPGEQEDLQGLPFVGKAGQLLTKILESAGINRETETYITNTVKCRPPGNRNPHPTEVMACQPYLLRQIQLIKPKILILLGNPSLKNILGDEYGITKTRGKWFTTTVSYMTDPLYIFPMFHPSYLLRNASKEKGSPKWLTWQDILEVKAALSVVE